MATTIYGHKRRKRVIIPQYKISLDTTPGFSLLMGPSTNDYYCHFSITISCLQACPFYNKGGEETSFIVSDLTKIPFANIPEQEGYWPQENQSFLFDLDTQALKAPGHAAKALFAVLELFKPWN